MALSNNNSLTQARAREKDQAALMLLTIYDGTPLRLVNDLVDVTSNGNVFTGFPFAIDVSVDDGETLQTIQLTLDNVTLEMITWVRSFTKPVPIKIEAIFSGAPDFVEDSVSELVIRTVRYNEQVITATLMADDDLNQLLPSDTYNSLDYPGLF